ncbi:hypothetical protein FQN49_001060 [Arthroderma sp. PD_2]|nr:hypothetical protein FQN49_001060 [Arthroderma sp. PD_2]
MSSNRLLPKPPALCYDYLGRDIPETGTTEPLAHRIMVHRFSSGLDAEENDTLSKNAMLMTGMEAISHAAMSHYRDNNSFLAKLPAPTASDQIRPGLTTPIPSRKAVSAVVSEAHQERVSSPSSPKSSSSDDSNVQFCLCGPEPKIPRPRNAFILFRQQLQGSVVAENPKLANPDISKIIGKMWRGLSAKEQAPWKKHADEEKARHQQKYPGYRYQPRRPGRKRKTAIGTAPAVRIDSTGASICSRCGGKPMKAPSTPSTSFIPGFNDQVDCSPEKPERARSQRGRPLMKIENVPNPIDVAYDGWRPAPLHDDNIPPLSPSTKRRRREVNEMYPSVCQSMGPENPYLLRTTTLPRPELVQSVNASNYTWNPQSPHSSSVPPSPHDPSLVLPPIQTVPLPYPQTRANVGETAMTIPFLSKISLLSKGSPSFTSCSSLGSEHAGGAVVAIEGQDPELITYVAEYLNNALSCDDGRNVRIFKGPEAGAPTALGDTRAAAGNFLETIFSWYKISGRIIDFLNDRFSSTAQPPPCDEESKSNASLQSIIPKTEDLHLTSADSSEIVYTPNSSETVHTPTSSSSDSAFRIALVPRYQLATTEAHVCSTSTSGSHDPIDHWERMAVQWGSCVGPDITVYIRDCDQDEMSRYGEGNPVENRLNDVRTLVIRRLISSTEGIDEKALRRVGFEVKEFLRK